MPFRRLLMQCGAIRATRLTMAYALVGMGAWYLQEPPDLDETDSLRRSLLGLLLIFLGYGVHAGSVGMPGVPREQQRSLLGGMRDDLIGSRVSLGYTAASVALLGLNARLSRSSWGMQEELAFLATGLGLLPHALHRATARHCAIALVGPAAVAPRCRRILALNHVLALLLDFSALQVGRHGAMLMRWLATDLGAAAFRTGPGDRGWSIEGPALHGRQVMHVQLFMLLLCRLFDATGQVIEVQERETGRPLFSTLPFVSLRAGVRMFGDCVYFDRLRAQPGFLPVQHFLINEIVFVMRERLMQPYLEAYPRGVTSWPLPSVRVEVRSYIHIPPVVPAAPAAAQVPLPGPGPGPGPGPAMAAPPDEFRILIRIPLFWELDIAQDAKRGRDAKGRRGSGQDD